MMTDKLIQPIKSAIENKKYSWFDSNLPYNINIIGVRGEYRSSNTFNDYLYVIYRDDNLNWVIKQYPITTDPGISQLVRPLNKNGTAILVPGQYRSTYKVDLHSSKYPALCQRLGPVSVYRDNNRDENRELDSSTIQTGYFGINIHKAGWNSEYVNNWSAGCQVFKRFKDFDEFMDIVNKSRSIFGNKFTYTLITKEDLI